MNCAICSMHEKDLNAISRKISYASYSKERATSLKEVEDIERELRALQRATVDIEAKYQQHKTMIMHFAPDETLVQCAVDL